MDIIQISNITARQIKELSDILVSVVISGASVGFLKPFSLSEASNYWSDTSVLLGDNHYLWAVCDAGVIIATVQLIISRSINGKHRAEVAKLLVSPKYQGKNIASKIMTHLEKEAQNLGIALLLLDTQTASHAERFYLHLGWQKVGEIPSYAKSPDGNLCSTSYFYKQI